MIDNSRETISEQKKLSAVTIKQKAGHTLEDHLRRASRHSRICARYLDCSCDAGKKRVSEYDQKNYFRRI